MRVREARIKSRAITHRPYTGKLDDLSEQPVKEIIGKVLKNDAKKAFDKAAFTQFNTNPLRVVPTGGTSTTALTLTTNGTATLTNNIGLKKQHVKLIVDTMKERNIPPYIGDDYVAIGRPSALRPIKDDLEAIHQYTQAGFQLIMNAEIGRYENTRFVEQTNVLAGVAHAGTAWSNAQSDKVVFFGGDMCAEGVAVPEEMRGKIPETLHPLTDGVIIH